MRSKGIGRSELEVLHYIHDHHPVAVRDVAAHFAQTHGHVRTTTLNVMRRLTAKGYLQREKTGGVHLYSPRVAKSALMRRMIGDFVEQALGGSLSPFVAYLAEQGNFSRRDLADLKRLADQLDAKQPENKP